MTVYDLSMTIPPKPLVLLILDGFGHREEKEDNAIAAANKPVWDALWRDYPHSTLSGSGLDVGLPDGQFGNSEVGHMTLGAGRIVYQQLTRIDKDILDGTFFQNPAYCEAIDKAVASGKAVHIWGLLSDGGVHSHENHILAILEMAARRGAKQLYLHAFLDGRDTPPRSAQSSIKLAQDKLDTLGVGRFASLCGRYYAMDRDKRWERVEPAYDLLTTGSAHFQAGTAAAGLAAAYARDENDEFVKPTVIGEPVRLHDGDAVIFMNFRADRARQLTRAFTDATFSGFARKTIPTLAAFVMTSEYADDIAALCAYPPATLKNSLGEYLASMGKTQLRIAETEKYAHVTFFFSGGREALYNGEQRVLVDSPKVATYDLKPEMSAFEVTDKLVEAIGSGLFDVIICNYANGDMVGHTGIFAAAVKAVEALDQCVGRVRDAVLAAGGECLITADHGNCEQMHDHEVQQAHTQHTCEQVPFLYIGQRSVQISDNGTLADVAPSMLALMGLPQPEEMDGRNLLTLQ
jgi:2,3-bisphosphoglycerate-independent phosphoglycerate mutase